MLELIGNICNQFLVHGCVVTNLLSRFGGSSGWSVTLQTQRSAMASVHRSVITNAADQCR
jgi:hypothetical protein